MNIGELTATLGVDDSGLAEAERAFKHYETTANESIASINNNWNRSTTKQVGLIQDIQNALVGLKEKRANAFTIEDIEKYNRKIQEAEQDLKAYQEAGLPAEKQTNKLTDSFGKFATKAVLVGVALKTFKSIIDSTEVTSSAFHAAIEGARSGLDYFLKSIAMVDFSNFVEGMRNAIRAGQDYSEMMSYISNVNREYQIRELDLTKQIEELRQVMYKRDIEGGKSTLKEKIAAGDQIIALMKQRADLEIDIARKSYLAVAELAGKKNKLSEEELNYAIKNFTEVEKLGTTYNSLSNILSEANEAQLSYILWAGKAIEEGTYKGGAALASGLKKQYDILKEYNIKSIEDVGRVIKELGNKAPEAGRLIEAFGSVTEEERQAIFEGIIGIKQAENQFLVDSRYIYRMIENMRDTDVRSQKLSQKESIREYTLYMAQREAILKGMKGGGVLSVPELSFPKSKVPEFGSKNWFAMVDVSPLEEMNRALADIAMRNAVFADSFDPVSAQMEVTGQQIQYLTNRLNFLWEQGYRPGYEVVDQTIEELKKYLQIQQDIQKEMATTIDWGGLLSNAFEGMANSITDALNETENVFQAFGKFFADFIKGLIIKLIAATIAATAFAIVMTLITGGGNIALSGAMKGLSGFKDFFKFGFGKMTGMQHGGTVPPGYPNDSYPAMLTSGEEVLPPKEIKRGGQDVTITPEFVKIPMRDLYIRFKKYEKERDRIGT